MDRREHKREGFAEGRGYYTPEEARVETMAQQELVVKAAELYDQYIARGEKVPDDLLADLREKVAERPFVARSNIGVAVWAEIGNRDEHGQLPPAEDVDRGLGVLELLYGPESTEMIRDAVTISRFSRFRNDPTRDTGFVRLVVMAHKIFRQAFKRTESLERSEVQEKEREAAVEADIRLLAFLKTVGTEDVQRDISADYEADREAVDSAVAGQTIQKFVGGGMLAEEVALEEELARPMTSEERDEALTRIRREINDLYTTAKGRELVDAYPAIEKILDLDREARTIDRLAKDKPVDYKSLLDELEADLVSGRYDDNLEGFVAQEQALTALLEAVQDEKEVVAKANLLRSQAKKIDDTIEGIRSQSPTQQNPYLLDLLTVRAQRFQELADRLTGA